MSWPASPELETYVLRLFVAGTTTRSQNAITNVRLICDQHLRGHVDLEVIDVYTHPQETRDFQIVATPTLVKVTPEPLRRIVGDLSNRERVLAGLNLAAAERERPAAP
ncbi:MAG TPA: circadian clock KaiB family protein [Caulobacteraceae bacterium]|jgi:circadian clock protein KaiB